MSVMHYLQDKTFQDIVKNLVLSFLSAIITPLIQRFIQRHDNAPNIRKYRFEKIPVSEKGSILARIDKLTKEPATKNTLVRIKYCYEQMGIYLPIWCCNKLICFISDRNVSSVDNRLHCFLKYSFVGVFSDGKFTVNTRRVHKGYWMIAVFAVFSLCVQFTGGIFTNMPFLSGGNTVLFMLFSLVYFIMIFLTVIFTCNLINEIRLAVQFGRLFEAWLKSERESPEQLALF
ncbi:type VI secretion protein [Escherichia coli]|uniref:type VI secretion protein n=1 Tax=Escherichia coli TaxID=562 RepID=UPI000BE26790|nr:type VI secretion protein [Escherichia coli]PDN92798.1 type VI secretion protein [Escherichia coli]